MVASAAALSVPGSAAAPPPDLSGQAAERHPAAAPSPSPQAKVLNGLNEPGIVGPGSVTPGSPSSAAGRGKYVEFRNSEIVAYDADDLSLQTTATLASFIAGSSLAFSPKVIFDPKTDRWNGHRG
jgi:hypothetical protein